MPSLTTTQNQMSSLLPSQQAVSPSTPTPTHDHEEHPLPPLWLSKTQDFLQMLGSGTSQKLPEDAAKKDFYTDVILGQLKVDHVERGRVTCYLTVKPPLVNAYGTLQGGAAASTAELVMMACARSVVKQDTDLILGDFGLSYLSAAALNAELEVIGSVVRGGRNITVTSAEFRSKGTKRLVYSARATFYNLPVTSL